MVGQGKQQRVAIIGAGLSGLAAARALVEAGKQVVVFDKGRAAGGRSCSRRALPYAFDHGAQYFTARDPRFRSEVAAWTLEGVVAPWEGRIVSLRAGQALESDEHTERLVGAPKMSALAGYLARGLDLRCGTRVAALARHAEQWALEDEAGSPLGGFDQLVVTAPPAQAAALLEGRSDLAQRAAEIELRPCWAVLLGFADPLELRFDGAFCEDSSLSWIARNNSKPGRPQAESWVLHAGPEWTEAHLLESREVVIAELTNELQRVTGAALPELRHRDAHLWRYALAASELSDECLVDEQAGIALAGDAYLGGRVEGAWLSGLAAGERLVRGRPDRA